MTVPTVAPGETLMEVMIPASKVGLIIGRSYVKVLLSVVLSIIKALDVEVIISLFFAGKGGETIKNLQVRFL